LVRSRDGPLRVFYRDLAADHLLKLGFLSAAVSSLVPRSNRAFANRRQLQLLKVA
jgi:hypothetical protein